MSDRDTETYNTELRFQALAREQIAALRLALAESVKATKQPLPWQTEAILKARMARMGLVEI